jgi:hypothetical protein
MAIKKVYYLKKLRCREGIYTKVSPSCTKPLCTTCRSPPYHPRMLPKGRQRSRMFLPTRSMRSSKRSTDSAFFRTQSSDYRSYSMSKLTLKLRLLFHILPRSYHLLLKLLPIHKLFRMYRGQPTYGSISR